ncbi:MAG: alpha/beta hydrolase fold domain-containing protein [Acetobacteraceae bacterium]
MYEDPRLDHEMRLAALAQDEAAARFPPIRLEFPFAPQRAINDALALLSAAGGPTMAAIEDRWIAAHGRRIFCRVYRPRTDRALPLLVYFHGGGWVWSSVDTHDRLARELAEAGGLAVVSVDYALSPEAAFPQALEECAAVIHHLGAHGGDWAIDPKRILLGGDSAGGNLALAGALLLRAVSGPSLRGILAIYPVADSNLATPSYREFGEGYVLTAEKMRFYWSVYAPRAADRLHPLAAPLRADLAGLPPVMVQLAELDVLRSEGEALAGKLEAAGVGVTRKIYPGMLHGFLRATERVARAREAAADAGAWLRRQAG